MRKTTEEINDKLLYSAKLYDFGFFSCITLPSNRIFLWYRVTMVVFNFLYFYNRTQFGGDDFTRPSTIQLPDQCHH